MDDKKTGNSYGQIVSGSIVEYQGQYYIAGQVKTYDVELTVNGRSLYFVPIKDVIVQ